jgi:hypothetical protein
VNLRVSKTLDFSRDTLGSLVLSRERRGALYPCRDYGFLSKHGYDSTNIAGIFG